MSHSTVCNTAVSTKKTSPIDEISMQVLCNAACGKRNAPVSAKEECVLEQAIKRVYGCEYVYVIFK